MTVQETTADEPVATAKLSRRPKNAEAPGPASQAQRVSRMDTRTLVETYAGLVKSTGQDLLQHLDCPVDLEDLLGWGYQGLLEAHQRFDPHMEVSFASFAFYRIRGAMYDGLRSAGWAVRGTAIRLQDALAVNDYLESQMLSRAGAPRAKSFASAVNHLDHVVGDCVTICLLQNTHLEMVSETTPAAQNREAEHRELSHALHQAIANNLDDHEREVLLAYHVEEWSMSEIAERMGYSKSWVSRINARAIDKIKKALFDDSDDWELYMIRG